MDFLIQNIRSPALLGEALRRRRKQLGWTQKELSAHSGVKQANLSALENGAAGVRLMTLFRVLAALDVDLNLRSRSSRKEPHA